MNQIFQQAALLSQKIPSPCGGLYASGCFAVRQGNRGRAGVRPVSLL